MSRNSIVILTGAGISAESGVATFRDPDGLWAKHRIEDVATPEAFERDPDKVHNFYNMRRRGLASGGIEPNAAHRALAVLEEQWTDDVLLVTQNIDDLHERAGSTHLIHMHGELLKARCTACYAVMPWTEDMETATPCPECGSKGGMRPHVVWFGERPLEMDAIYDKIEACGLFLSIGTSGNVYPAAGFVEAATLAGAHTVELNLEPSQGANLFDETIHGPATEVVPAYVEKILKDGWSV